MKELDNQLAELVKKGLEAAEATGNFVIDQAPHLLQEFYRWHIANSIMGIVFPLIATYIMYRVFKMVGREEEGEWHDTKIFGKYYEVDEFPFFITVFVSAIVIAASLIVFFTNLYSLVQILVSPKLYLIEYFLK